MMCFGNHEPEASEDGAPGCGLYARRGAMIFPLIVLVTSVVTMVVSFMGSFMASTGLDCETLFVGTFDARSTEGIECTNLRTVEFGLLISGTKSGSNSCLSSCLEEYSEPSHRESCESDSFVACDARCKCASEQASTCWLCH